MAKKETIKVMDRAPSVNAQGEEEEVQTARRTSARIRRGRTRTRSETQNSNAANGSSIADSTTQSESSSSTHIIRQLPQSILERNRQVAEREASRLARPDTSHSNIDNKNSQKNSNRLYGKKVVSSTPSGFIRPSESAAALEEEWCGPFSVARQMIAAREEARRKRQSEQKENETTDETRPNHNHHPLDEMMQEVEMEKRQRANPSMQWRSSIHDDGGKQIFGDGNGKEMNLYAKRQKRYNQQKITSAQATSNGGKVPSLFQLCINYLVDNFQHVESLGGSHYIDASIRRELSNALVGRGKMNGAAFDTLFLDDGDDDGFSGGGGSSIDTLDLVDCTDVTQEQLVEALEKLSNSNDKNGGNGGGGGGGGGGLRALILGHAGRCFGSRAVNAIVNGSASSSSLFALSIGGAYMLTDKDAARLIRFTAKTLSSIEFNACPLIGEEFCRSLSQEFGAHRDDAAVPSSINSFGGGGYLGYGYSPYCLLELSLEDISLSRESLLALATTFPSGNSMKTALQNLKSLSLKSIDALDDEVLSILLHATSTTVTTTEGTSSTNNLEGINLSNNHTLTDNSLSSIRKCNTEGKLKALQLSGLKHLTSVGLEAFFTLDIPGLPPPPVLRKLDLSDCGSGIGVGIVTDEEDGGCGGAVNDTVVDLALSASARNGHGDNTSMYDERTDRNDHHHQQQQQHLSSSGGLVHLNISGSTSITDKSMENLAEKCSSSLQELEVNFCPRISDKGLGYLVDVAGQQFSKLHIWGCAQITDDFLDGHSRVVVRDGGVVLQIFGAWMKQSGKQSRR